MCMVTQRFLSIILYNIGIKRTQSFSGNYQDCLSDVKAATTLQASYLKAIIRGKNKKKFENLKLNLNLAFFSLSERPKAPSEASL